MVSADELKKLIEPRHIVQILRDQGCSIYEETPEALIFPTICHNPIGAEGSMKLYYYKDSKLFYCYTQCNCTYDIFGLLEQIAKVNNNSINFIEMKNYVAEVVNYREKIELGNETPYESVSDYYRRKKARLPYKIFNKNVLNYFPFRPVVEWLNAGITEETLWKYNIRYYPAENRIIIPCFDEDSNLVGIRYRALEEIDMAFGKYHPLILENVKYIFLQSQFCYGLWNTKAAIARTKKAIVFEGEKSVMLLDNYEDNCSVSVFGSNISKAQILSLIRAGAREITIAFDKENVDMRSKRSSEYFAKIRAVARGFSPYCNMSFIFDFDNLLRHKDSPIDRGKEIFDELYNKRVKV